MKRLALALALALVLLAPAQARAYSMTCRQAVLLAGTSDPEILVGFAIGVLDFAAALVCIGRLPACNCLQNLFESNPEGFGREFGARVGRCAANRPNDAAFGPTFDSVRTMCPF